MPRPIALVAASLLAFVAVSTACVAASADSISFTLEPQRRDSGRIQASFKGWDHDSSHSNWSTGFLPSELIGLEVSSFRDPGTRPLHFAIAREAGRLDCAGSGGRSFASGTCRFTADPAFVQLLVSRGIGRPTQKEAFGLMAVNARRDLIFALAEARYPTPTIDDLTALSALGVNRAYVSDLARAGYRPPALHNLVEFKALGIDAPWIAGFQRIGYSNVPSDDLVQMRALGITPDYVAGFQRIGYRNLRVDDLVQLKALNVTPEFARAMSAQHSQLPDARELVEMKVLGRRRR